LRKVSDIDLVLEACFSARVDSAVLYAVNLTPGFFDLSSGDAGAILQKLGTYGIRLAVVCAPDTVGFSRRFNEMTREESCARQFRVFESVDAAQEWRAVTDPT
jgi:hypothetical protein